MERENPEVSVVVPLLNEQDNIEPLYEQITQTLAGKYNYEIIAKAFTKMRKTALSLHLQYITASIYWLERTFEVFPAFRKRHIQLDLLCCCCLSRGHL